MTSHDREHSNIERFIRTLWSFRMDQGLKLIGRPLKVDDPFNSRNDMGSHLHQSKRDFASKLVEKNRLYSSNPFNPQGRVEFDPRPSTLGFSHNKLLESKSFGNIFDLTEINFSFILVYHWIPGGYSNLNILHDFIANIFRLLNMPRNKYFLHFPVFYRN